MTRKVIPLGLLPILAWAAAAAGQSSSLLRMPRVRTEQGDASLQTYTVRQGSDGFGAVQPKAPSRPATRAIERASMIAVPPAPPRKFETNMLIKIIVRQNKRYEAESEYNSEKKWKFDALLSRWMRFHPHNRLGEDQLNAGNPGAKFDLKHKYETDGDTERKDTFTTTITAKIIDVKPNGNLVLEARQMEEHDEERISITLTGSCRSEDVTPDNSVLSSQIAEMLLVEKNDGAVRDATTRGWVPRLLDTFKPL